MTSATVGFFVWASGTLIGNLMRLPYYRDHYQQAVEVSKKDFSEFAIMSLIGLGFVMLPIGWFAFDFLSHFNRQQDWLSIALGSLGLPAALWLFYRSHKDLGRQWSTSLEIRRNHQLIT